jgi:NAD-dependent deacetylase
MFTLQNYVADPDLRRRAWEGRRDHPAWAAEPSSRWSGRAGCAQS